MDKQLYREIKRGSKTIRYPYISISHGMSGYFAVMIWWNPDLGGFEEPYDTGIGRFSTSLKAIQEGQSWAKEQDIDFVYHNEVIPGSYHHYRQWKSRLFEWVKGVPGEVHEAVITYAMTPGWTVKLICYDSVTSHREYLIWGESKETEDLAIEETFAKLLARQIEKEEERK